MKRFFTDLKKHGKFVIYAGKSELKAEVANSYLNWLWWILEPFCFMLVYAFVFGKVFGMKEDYYILFIFIGITMWDFFNRMLLSSVQIVKNNKSIVSKVYLPKYMLILVKAYVNGFKMAVSFVIIIVMMIVYQVPVTWNLLWLAPILLTLFTVTFAICAFLLHFGVYVDDLTNVLRIFLRILFYLTGVFYNIELRVGKQFGAAVGRLVTECNPMALLISSMRDILLYGHAPHYKWLLAWLVGSTLVSALGVKLIYKNENSYVKVI